MSRELNGTTAYLTRANRLGFNGYPLSVFLWFHADTFASTNKTLFCIGQDTGAANDMLKMAVLTGGAIEIISYDATSGYVGTQTSATASTGTWQSAAAVWASTSNRSVYLNGGNKATISGASNVVFADLSRTAVGANILGPAYEFFDGRVAHCAVWATALTDDDVAMLHTGLHPLRVKSTSLVAYWSLSGKDSPEIDIIGRNDLTVTNATVSNEEPRIARALSSYLVALGGTNGSPVAPEPPPITPPTPPPPSTPAVMNTRFVGLSWVPSSDYSPQGKDYLLSGVDSETGQVFSTTSPRIWGSEWASPRIQLLNSDPPVGTPDTAWTRAFTSDGIQLTRNINYSGVPQAVYRILPNAPFAQQGMCYIRGKIKLPATMPTVNGAGIFLCEVKNNYTDQKLQMDVVCSADPLWGNVPRWMVRLTQMRREYGIYNLWGASQNTPYKNTVPQQDFYYQDPDTNVNQLSGYHSFGAFAPDPNGPAPDWTRWFTYEFAFRLQAPSGLVSGNAPQGWAWCSTSVGTSSSPPPNGVGTQRFYLTGRNMNSEPNPGATIIFPFGHYSGFNGITGLPITWRQVEVYDHWPSDASVHPADAL